MNDSLHLESMIHSNDDLGKIREGTPYSIAQHLTINLYLEAVSDPSTTTRGLGR